MTNKEMSFTWNEKYVIIFVKIYKRKADDYAPEKTE